MIEGAAGNSEQMEPYNDCKLGCQVCLMRLSATLIFRSLEGHVARGALSGAATVHTGRFSRAGLESTAKTSRLLKTKDWTGSCKPVENQSDCLKY